MEKKLIEKIIRKMKAELSEEQLSKLTAVCYEVIKETQLEEHVNYIEIFLASKKIEGCSKRTNEYYSQVLKSFEKNIHIPLCSATTDIIRIYLAKYQKNNKRSDDNPALFVSSRTYKKYEGKIRISINNTETIIRNSRNSLNISRAHPHKFRRTIATKAIDKGMPIDQVQLLLGHS